MQEQSPIETMKIEGGQLIDRVKQLIHEGNVRHIIVKRGAQTVVQLPLTIGVAGALLAPQLALLGALATLIANCSVEVERMEMIPPTNGQSAKPVPTEKIQIVS